MVKRSTMIGDVDEGGLKMVDVKSMFKALRVKWTQRYNDLNQAAWKSLLSYFITPYGGDLMNYDQVKEWKNIPMFYKDMFNSYFHLIQPDKVKVYSQCIWHNQRICINNKSCFYDGLYSKGIMMVSDLFLEDGRIVPFDTWVDRGVSKKTFEVEGTCFGCPSGVETNADERF